MFKKPYVETSVVLKAPMGLLPMMGTVRLSLRLYIKKSGNQFVLFSEGLSGANCAHLSLNQVKRLKFELQQTVTAFDGGDHAEFFRAGRFISTIEKQATFRPFWGYPLECGPVELTEATTGSVLAMVGDFLEQATPLIDR